MQLTAREKSTGELTSASLDLAQQTLSQQGFVVLEAVLPAHWVVTMRETFTAELQNHYASKPQTLVRQRHHGGFQPPLTMPFLDPQIIANPLVFQVLEQLLGQSFFGCLPYGCNTTFPGSQEQNVHRDCGHLFPELTSAAPPVLAVVNLLLDDFTAANGATEILARLPSARRRRPRRDTHFADTASTLARPPINTVTGTRRFYRHS
jgi:hypothetical protein